MVHPWADFNDLYGRPTTMDAAQLEALLRSTPVERIEKAEIMYSAPPQ